MLHIKDTDYDDCYLEVDITIVGMEFKFVDGPDEEDCVSVIMDSSQLNQIVSIITDDTVKSIGNFVDIPQISDTEELDVCIMRSFNEYMLMLEESGIGISMTPSDKELLVAYIEDYLGW